jgi:hypothetical protein
MHEVGENLPEDIENDLSTVRAMVSSGALGMNPSLRRWSSIRAVDGVTILPTRTIQILVPGNIPMASQFPPTARLPTPR